MRALLKYNLLKYNLLKYNLLKSNDQATQSDREIKAVQRSLVATFSTIACHPPAIPFFVTSPLQTTIQSRFYGAVFWTTLT
jgi:hypothetical protein